MFELAIEAGANDFSDENDHYLITTDRENLTRYIQTLKQHCDISHAEVTKQAETDMALDSDARDTVGTIINTKT